MKNFFLLNYAVNGIKTIDKEVSLSFYKKVISKPIDTQKYNIKGIYGMNGSGKSGIVASANILKNLLVNDSYLSNPLVQDSLNEMINKKTESLTVKTNFLAVPGDHAYVYEYEIELRKSANGKYAIDHEELSYKNAYLKKDEYISLLKTKNGEIIFACDDISEYSRKALFGKTANLLSSSTISSLFMEKFDSDETLKEKKEFLFASVFMLLAFGSSICIYMEDSDDHTIYSISNLADQIETGGQESTDSSMSKLFKYAHEMNNKMLNVITDDQINVPKKYFEHYFNTVKRLEKFIKIFKTDLVGIEIEKKEFADKYVCNLNTVYDGYKVNTEFESTGIKKLIKLFVYFQEMVNGGIVFIDELDSNLHDVYLCALLEYLMNCGKGQLCFTTHNVGPMDVLKKNKKSIDFLSIDHSVHPWVNNGNYSPSSLYRSGMIEGSPFNVDYFDFISVFDDGEGAD